METRRPIQAAFLACRQGNVEKTVDFLRKNPQQIESKDYDQKGFVEIALKPSNLPLFYAILKLIKENDKMDVLVKPFMDGLNAMKLAMLKDNLELFHSLNSDSVNLLAYFHNSAEEMLFYLSAFGGSKLCHFIISNNRAWLEMPVAANNLTLLQCAVNKENLDAVKVFLELGANVYGNDRDGYHTALTMAAHKGNVEITKLLLKYGAGSRLCHNKYTFHNAFANMNPSRHEIVELLLKHKIHTPSVTILGCYASFIERGFTFKVRYHRDYCKCDSKDLITLQDLDYDLTQSSDRYSNFLLDSNDTLNDFRFHCTNAIQVRYSSECTVRLLFKAAVDPQKKVLTLQELLDLAFAVLEQQQDAVQANLTAIRILASVMSSEHALSLLSAVRPFIDEVNANLRLRLSTSSITATLLHVAIKKYTDSIPDCKPVQNECKLAFIQMLLSLGADINRRQIQDGITTDHTPLIKACTYFYNPALLFPLVERLVNGGANVNDQDYLLRTPLHHVLQYKTGQVRSWKDMEWKTAAIKLLLEAGADVNSIKDFDGSTVLDYAKRYELTYPEIYKLISKKAKKRKRQ